MERAPRGEPEQSVLPMGGGRVRLSTTWKDDPEQVEMIEEWQLAPEGPAAANAAAAAFAATQQPRPHVHPQTSTD